MIFYISMMVERGVSVMFLFSFLMVTTIFIISSRYNFPSDHPRLIKHFRRPNLAQPLAQPDMVIEATGETTTAGETTTTGATTPPATTTVRDGLL